VIAVAGALALAAGFALGWALHDYRAAAKRRAEYLQPMSDRLRMVNAMTKQPRR
jgi:hypothetical protein